ncbi:type III secretion protein [Cupriavidus sp. UYMSc13B]|nr:type III secretion protein [Cupriavidus sp. UYMSc13B]
MISLLTLGVATHARPQALAAAANEAVSSGVPVSSLAPTSNADPKQSSADGISATQPAAAADNSNPNSKFVANDVGSDTLLNALSAQIHRPVVASENVRRKRLTGHFDLAYPDALLRQLSDRMALTWYDDGSSIYVYDNSEIKNSMVSMQRATVQSLRTFVRETHLYDSRFPIRGDDLGFTFYVSGAPIYVNLVTAAAKYLDQIHMTNEKDQQLIKVVRLQNSFVEDRTYKLRDREVNIPGMATVLAQVYEGRGNPRIIPSALEQPAPTAAAESTNTDANPKAHMPFSMTTVLPAPSSSSAGMSVMQMPALGTPASVAVSAVDGVRAVAYPDTNSIVLVGPTDKVVGMESLVQSLDVIKRQIELSLWIIDIKKSTLNELGLNWQGKVERGDFSVSLNGSRSFTTLDGTKFLASVAGMSQNGDAKVVSHPVLLTQENVRATFDSNQTFYAKLIAERTVDLGHVTYGTMINVLPRLTKDGSQVEMVVNVEDGNVDPLSADTNSTLPMVNRTEINTVARVPREMSLLIGGNTRTDVTRDHYRIPGLDSIPFIGALFRGHTERRTQVVRVFLIQPRLLGLNASWQDGQSWEPDDAAGDQTLQTTVRVLQSYMDKQQ